MPDALPDRKQKALAEAVGQALYAADKTAQMLGMTLIDIGPGTAVVQMTIRPDMANVHGSGHGGMIFSLADGAFAFASNSHNQANVAQSCTISYLAPTRVGDVLTAEAREAFRKGRTGVYDISVSNQEGALVALFRGHARRIEGEVVPGLKTHT